MLSLSSLPPFTSSPLTFHSFLSFLHSDPVTFLRTFSFCLIYIYSISSRLLFSLHSDPVVFTCILSTPVLFSIRSDTVLFTLGS
jgi:hypothetical protein